MTRPITLLCAAHLVGNAALLLLGYDWLGMDESDALHLSLSIAVIAIFAVAAVWLHATSLVLFRRGNGLSFAAASGRVLRHLLPLALLGVVVLCIYAVLMHFYNSFGHQAFTIGSYTTMKLRRPVAPDNVLKAFRVFIWVVRWFAVPGLALPLAACVANAGWPGFTLRSFPRGKKVWFSLLSCLCLVAAIHLPLHLFLWKPEMGNFSLEVVSVTLRLGLGYLLFTAGLLLAECFAVTGTPGNSSPKPR